MKHLRTITAVLTILFFAVSCKKQSVDPAATPVAATKKLQTLIWAAGYQSPQYFTYDTQGRLVKEDDNYQTEGYEYTGNTVHITDYNKSKARIVSDITGTTDNAGRMISFTLNNTYTLNSPYTQQAVLTYDANGYLTQIKFTRLYQGNTEILTYDFTVIDGDYTKLLGTYIINGQFGSSFTEIFEYYTDKNDPTGIDTYPIVYETFGYNNGLFGKTNKHLIKHVQNGVVNPTWVMDYTYTLDSNGYPQTHNLTGTWNSSATYSFQ